MSKAFLFCIIPLFFLLSQAQADVYDEYARQWVLRHAYFNDGTLRVSEDDLHGMRSLIAISEQRSSITMQAQEKALEMVTYFWHLWQNIAQTRLNPSHDRPYATSRIAVEYMQDFFNLIEQQEAICKEYSHVAQQVVHGDVLSSSLANQGIQDMRAQARVFMLDALADVKKQLGELYDVAFYKKQSYDLLDEVEDDQAFRSFNLADFILAYVPNLAVNTFIHADKSHNLLLQEGWQLLDRVQKIGNHVWKSIEESRSAFYRALLVALDEYA